MKNTTLFLFVCSLLVFAFIGCSLSFDAYAMQDSDITQPESYIPHTLPGAPEVVEESAEAITPDLIVEETPESDTEVVLEQADPLPDYLPEEPETTKFPDVSNWWYAEPTPSTSQFELHSPLTLGASSLAPTDEIQLLQGINESLLILVELVKIVLACCIIWFFILKPLKGFVF